jgi:RNA polymerase sigma-70 factor, ECF subfamily
MTTLPRYKSRKQNTRKQDTGASGPTDTIASSPGHPVIPSSRHPVIPSSSDPEVALMLRVQRDEPGAFAELVEQFWTRIFGRFYRCFSDRQEAEDLAQEVFLRLYRSRKRYQPRARFGTWLFHITQNVARNALRSRKRHPSVRLSSLVSSEEDAADHPLLTDAAEPPSRPLERSELVGVVRAAVADLAGRQRIAVELHQFQDRTYAEVAAEMDMTPKAAKSLLYRARIQLRALLTTYMESLA